MDKMQKKIRLDSSIENNTNRSNHGVKSFNIGNYTFNMKWQLQ